MLELSSEVLSELRRLLAGRTTVLASDLGNFLLLASRNTDSLVTLRDFGGAVAFVREHLHEWEPDPGSPPGIRLGFRIKSGCATAIDSVGSEGLPTSRGASLWSALTNPAIATGRNAAWSTESKSWRWLSDEKEVAAPDILLPRLTSSDYAEFVEDFVTDRESSLSLEAAADLRASVLSHDGSMGSRLFRAVAKHGLVRAWEAYRTTRVLDKLRERMASLDDDVVEEILSAAQRSRQVKPARSNVSAQGGASSNRKVCGVGGLDAKDALALLLPYLSSGDIGKLRVPLHAVASILADMRELTNSKAS